MIEKGGSLTQQEPQYGLLPAIRRGDYDGCNNVELLTRLDPVLPRQMSYDILLWTIQS